VERELIRGLHKLPERLMLVLDIERAVEVQIPGATLKDRQL
jgi:hypothetical protein